MKSVTLFTFTFAFSVTMAVTLFCSEPLQAQDRQANRGDVIRVRVERGRASAYPGGPASLAKGWLEGELVDIRPDSLVLLTAGTNFLFAIDRGEIGKVEVRRDLSGGQAFWRGAKLGFIVGAVPGALVGVVVVAAFDDAFGYNSTDSSNSDLLAGAVLGALMVGVPTGVLFGGIGAAGGKHAWSPARFSVRASPRVSSRPGLNLAATFRF